MLAYIIVIPFCSVPPFDHIHHNLLTTTGCYTQVTASTRVIRYRSEVEKYSVHSDFQLWLDRELEVSAFDSYTH